MSNTILEINFCIRTQFPVWGSFLDFIKSLQISYGCIWNGRKISGEDQQEGEQRCSWCIASSIRATWNRTRVTYSNQMNPSETFSASGRNGCLQRDHLSFNKAVLTSVRFFARAFLFASTRFAISTPFFNFHSFTLRQWYICYTQYNPLNLLIYMLSLFEYKRFI